MLLSGSVLNLIESGSDFSDPVVDTVPELGLSEFLFETKSQLTLTLMGNLSCNALMAVKGHLFPFTVLRSGSTSSMILLILASLPCLSNRTESILSVTRLTCAID